MEHFEGRNREPEDSSNSRPFKIPRQDIASGLQTRKAAFEKFASKGYGVCSAGPSTHHKPIQPEPSLAVKPSSGDETEEDPKPSHLSSVAQKFGVQLQPTNRGNDEKPGCAKFSIKTSDPSKEDPKPLNRKPAWNKFLALPDKEKSSLGLKPNLNFPSQENEAKPEFSKVAAIREKLRSATQENELKPPVSKRPSAQKPSLNKEVSQNEDTSNKSGFQQKQSGLQETVMENTKGKGTGTAKSILVNKSRQEKSDSSHKLHKTNKAPAAGRQSDETKQKDDRDRSSRKPKPLILPAVFRMSQVPEKPSRPPTVYLGMFRNNPEKKGPKKEDLKQKAPSSGALAPSIPPSHSAVQLPPPPASHPSLQVPAAPTLPPRNIKPSSETINLDTEENYDDVEFVSRGHGSTQRGQGSDGETYEDIHDIRSPRGNQKKQDKEDRRRMEQEKKEQKEKEKKEHELKKKFKLTEPIEVLHLAQACVDHKGGKNELTFKQGDKIEIIRLTNNPEGKWLGRIKGCYGYIKTTMVEIDYDSLKRKQKPSTRAAGKYMETDQETYDDVGGQDTTSSQSGDQGGDRNVFPPPPSDQDIYDRIDEEDAISRSVSQDEDKNGIWPWEILKRLKVKDVKKKSVREKAAKVNEAEENENLFTSSSTKQPGKDYGDDVYDDVDSSKVPPPDPSVGGIYDDIADDCISDSDSDDEFY